MKSKIIFFLIVMGLLSLAPITIIGDTPLSIALMNNGHIVNTIQRFLGLTAFTLMFVQVMLGAYMQTWIEKLGGWVFQYHIFEGVFIYCLVLLHPTMFVFYNYFVTHSFDPVYVFLGFCVLCSLKTEYFYTLGRIAFWLLTIGVFAGLFRASTPFMRANWRKFHVFNYLVFLIIGIHAFFIGTDFSYMPFFAFAAVAYIIVLFTVLRKLPSVIAEYRKWLKN